MVLTSLYSGITPLQGLRSPARVYSWAPHRAQLLVTCAKGGKGKKGKGGKGKGGRAGRGKGRSGGKAGGGDSYGNKYASNNIDNLNPEMRMAQFKADETLMFEPVHADEGALQVVYAYPNEYVVGITSLGYQLVWAHMAMRSDIAVHRWFQDARDTPPKNVDLMGFSFAWEMDYVNLITMLEEVGIPRSTADRTDEHPIVFVGGPVTTANPEPLAEFFDVVLLGDGEELVSNFLAAVEATKGAPRQERLIALTQVPGVYVPALYEPEYESPSGPMTGIRPIVEGVPEKVVKQTYRGNVLASSTVVSPRMAWENIFMVEVVRSCPEMCRFCLASYLTLPFRTADLEGSLIPTIEKGLAATDRIGLLGASVTQHPEFESLLRFMTAPDKEHVRLSIASVRTNTVTRDLAQALADSGTKSLTIAVESGSERMRRIVNKKLAQAEIVEAAKNAAEGGLSKLKLYGMVGIPRETDEDIDATIAMLEDIRTAAPSLKLTLGCSTFVPKSHTPFQWYGVSKEGKQRLQRLEKACAKMGVDFRPESYKWSMIQAMLSRGDRRLTKVLLRVMEYGNSLGSFRRAFNDLEGEVPPMKHYVHENYEPGACVLPWSHLQGPLPEGTLIKHAAEAMQIADGCDEDEGEEGDAVPPELTGPALAGAT